jgi:hypothetical protein
MAGPVRDGRKRDLDRDVRASPRCTVPPGPPLRFDPMSLIVDTASAGRRLAAPEFRQWAESRTIFVSSEMRQLADLRRHVGGVLRQAGFSVVMFEDLGGRDEDAKRAYLDGVARSDIYLGILGDRYGTMLPSGRSPTHEEYREARRRGKRITFWLGADGSRRQGDAMDFMQEVQTFHTTGQFRDAEDLGPRVLQRLAEIAAEDESPWVKLGDACFRARVVRDEGRGVVIGAEVRDGAVTRYLEGLRGDQWGRSAEVQIALVDRAGEATVAQVVSERRSSSVRAIEITADVRWSDGRGGSMDSGAGGLSPDDITEAGLRAGLLGEPLPAALGPMSFMVDDADPLAEMPAGLPAAAEEAIAGLLIAQRLLGSGKASAIEHVAVGPTHLGQRHLELVYVEPRRYTNVEPVVRRIYGMRADARSAP